MDTVKPKKLFPCKICGEKFGRNQLKKHRKVKHPQPVPLLLISKRGVRVNERMSCDSCKVYRDLLWRYNESNKGVVHICTLCKPKLFDRSFNKLDALNFAKSGGGFETKRSKY
ncbi:hypothetical protein BG00_17145 [Pseudoalteromonas sp. SCSIO_11900]|jgi:hypothetical protein|uniref:hypothetical protein n=1 Tax=unclassified Pseudoalteromonas TaxID=194690 RepID=UPI000448D6A1|nr:MULTISPECIES: hypothetical protein [unclassified Pseudoalteromonas]EWS96842.1 hypothetical protein BG00_17145 [Pseudoalteromonas sp. SCSIO_11900]MDN3490764.1 hypothetical protein [Pseudoalteromonas sp. APC 3694]